MSINKRVVLKFGGSVLHSQDDFDGIRNEILRFVANGYQVIAVVSAYFGVTETLLSNTFKRGLAIDVKEFAELIASGEFRSATELKMYLTQHGSNASTKTPKELGFIACGNRACAAPISIDAEQMISALEQTPIVIVPGFSAVD